VRRVVAPRYPAEEATDWHGDRASLEETSENSNERLELPILQYEKVVSDMMLRSYSTSLTSDVIKQLIDHFQGVRLSLLSLPYASSDWSLVGVQQSQPLEWLRGHAHEGCPC
jgi:hypothetical protein